MAKRGGPVGVFNGNWRRKWREEMESIETDRRQFIIDNNKLNFGDALNELKAVDPEWEAWFDNDENIPPVIHWTDTDEIEELCRRMIERSIQCQEKISTTTRS